MFLLVPAYLGCPGQTAVKWLLLFAIIGTQILRFLVAKKLNSPNNYVKIQNV